MLFFCLAWPIVPISFVHCKSRHGLKGDDANRPNCLIQAQILTYTSLFDERWLPTGFILSEHATSSSVVDCRITM